jgi:hypothetical protein
MQRFGAFEPKKTKQIAMQRFTAFEQKTNCNAKICSI